MIFDENFSSNAVFRLRKEGKISEAYDMAIKLYDYSSENIWVKKAYAWVLIDLIKRELNSNNQNNAESFYQQLKKIDFINTGGFLQKKQEMDEVIEKQINFIELKLTPGIQQAKICSENGEHEKAINLYRKIINQNPNNTKLHESLGWELYKHGKQFFNHDEIVLGPAKQMLFEYINLKNPRPSLLHSLFLKLADKLIGKEGFNLVSFLHFWDLNNLTDDDFKPYKADNGNVYPSIAEKVIQHAAKDSLSKNILVDIEYILPFVDMAIGKFPENFWLTYYKVKLLHNLGYNQEAYEFSISVVKAKLNDYWAWTLLAETLIAVDQEKAFSCYCKALLCRSEEKFLASVRIKFAELLLQKPLFNEAKYEINQAIKSRESEGWKLTEILVHYQQTEWYSNATATTNNLALYKQHISLAESLLFDDLPWLNASVGNTYTTPKNPNKPKRKIYISIAGKSTPIEIAVSEKIYQFKKIDQGSGLKIKGEYDVENRFQIYLIESRDTAQKWDIFPEYIGIIDHVNHEKKLAHFIVDRKIDGVLHFADYPMTFKVADIVALKLSSYENDRGMQYSVLSCTTTDRETSSSTVKKFKSTVRIINGLGFTDNDIFVDRPLVDYFKIQDNDSIEGLAVLNFNKKKSTWGWKALKIDKHDKDTEWVTDYD